MYLKINNKRYNTKNAMNLIAILYLILMSGTIYQILYMSTFQTINLVITVFLMVSMIFYKTSFSNNTIKDKMDLIYLCVSFIAIIFLSSIMANNLWSFRSAFAQFCLLLMPYLISRVVPFIILKNYYLKVVFVIAVVSLLFWCFPILLDLLPKITADYATNGWNFEIYGIYAKNVTSRANIYLRNMGIFWEPGMYQGFLAFAMLLKLSEKVNFKNIMYQIVIGLTIISTQSATGYIILLIMSMLCLFRLVDNYIPKYRVIFILLSVVFIGFILLNNSIIFDVIGFFSPQTANKLFASDNISKNTRLYSLIGDAVLVFKHPFGIGAGDINQYRLSALNFLNAQTDGANINTSLTMMLYYGVIPGIYYMYLLISASSKLFVNFFEKFISILIMLIIINTEPHYLTLFFSCFFFYHNRGLCNSQNKSEINKTNIDLQNYKIVDC